MVDKQIIDLTIIDQKYKDKCSLIKAGKCKNVNIFIEQSRKLKAKEQECEELKNFHINLVGVKECEIRELVKYKQALDEIKKIANKFDYWNSNLSQASEILHEIIEKISEVEDGN